MQNPITQRVLNRAIAEAYYIIDTSATIRDAAKVFEISKSVLHKDVTERLMTIDPILADAVKVILKKNMDERHIRGGQSTKEKYKKKVEKKE